MDKIQHVRDVCYAVDESGSYQQVMSVGWEPKNEALSLAWEEIEEKIEEVKQEVLDGKKSPLAYHMRKRLLNEKLLSKYTNIRKRIIRKHMTPKGFDEADEQTLCKYAEALRISVEELKVV